MTYDIQKLFEKLPIKIEVMDNFLHLDVASKLILEALEQSFKPEIFTQVLSQRKGLCFCTKFYNLYAQ